VYFLHHGRANVINTLHGVPLPSPLCYAPDTGEGGVEYLYLRHQLGGTGQALCSRYGALDADELGRGGVDDGSLRPVTMAQLRTLPHMPVFRSTATARAKGHGFKDRL